MHVSNLAMKAAALHALLLQIVAARKWCLQNAGQCYGNQHAFTKVEHFPWVQSWGVAHARLADMDSDGDLDALVLKEGKFWFYERNSSGDLIEGTQLRVQFAPDTSMRIHHDHDEPAMAFELTDWDRDGDLDVILSDDGRLRYFEHLRPANASFFLIEQQVSELVVLDSYIEIVRETRPFPLSHSHTLEIVDWNQDGHLDVIVDMTRYFQSHHGKLQEMPAERNPFRDLRQTVCGDDELMAIRLADWDNDGDLDVIAHCAGYCVQWGYCQLSVSYAEQLADGTFLMALSGWASTVDLVSNSNLFLCWDCLQVIDWNGDGLLDLFTDSRVFLRSRASEWVPRKGSENPFAGLLFANARPYLVDWDLDGHLDMLVRESDHLRLILQKQGVLVEETLNFDIVPLSSKSVRTGIDVVDWDGDGDADLVVATFEGVLRVFDNQQGELVELNASEQDFLATDVLASFVASDHVLSDRKRELGLQLVDWDRDGDLDLLIGPWELQSSSYWEAYVGAAFFEQVEGKLVRRENHSFERVSKIGPYRPDWAWKVLDCDGDGELDLVRLWYDRYKSYSIQGAVSCKQQGGELLCENHCFVEPVLKYAKNGFALGDWDNDGDMDLVVIKEGSAREPFLMDNGFCVLEQACSGIGRCLASGQCSCPKDRSLSDCSGCAVGYYTPAYQIGGRNVHGCESCPVNMKEAVCAGRGVCVDDAYAHYAQSLQQTNLTSRTRGNGSCICATEHFVGLDQLQRQTCAQGTCPEGYMETAVNVTHLLHPQVQLSFGCQVCPAGSFSNGGRPCKQCEEGEIPSEDATSCLACNEHRGFLVFMVDEAGLHCILPPLQWVALAVFCLALVCFVRFLAMACCYVVPIADLTRQIDGVIVTSHGEHWLQRDVAVAFKHAEIPWLDTGEWRVKCVSKERLFLFAKDESRPMETSSGCLRYLGVPLALWLLCFGALALAALLSGYLTFLMASFAGVAAIFLAVGLHVYRHWRLCAKTPINKSREQFLHHLAKSISKPIRAERGSARGVTLRQLLFFQEFFESFIRERDMYYTSANLVVPLTKKDHVSYAELVGPTTLNWFVSHYWGMGVRHFIQALQRHGLHVAGDEDRKNSLAYWVCTFSNSQHHIVEELGEGEICNSSFFKAMHDRSCQGTVMVLDEEALPLQRAWCLFEVFQTFRLCRERSKEDEESVHYEGFVMTTSSGVLSAGGGGTDLCMAVADRLAVLDMRQAEATNVKDLEMIHDLVENAPGGFDSINALVRVCIRDALLTVYQRFQGDFQRLITKLNASVPSSLDEVIISETSTSEPRPSIPMYSEFTSSQSFRPPRISLFHRFSW
ncbi:Uncharacterized protein SCF082_LOCUS5607 [Durusdinium trenchii]|uniref:Uncharacterized protein n=1 Tax=Durusdinium trenchii TaxID=1381693 RepID=A0ABP0I6Z6_9DINO